MPDVTDATASPTFGDDDDTVSACTGECCSPVTIDGELYREMSRNPLVFRNGRYTMNMLTPRGPMPRHGTAEFDCKYFDGETRRCIAYDRRPQMCRDFPEGGVCGYCGGRFTEAHPVPPAAEGLSRTDAGRQTAMRMLLRQTSGKATGSSRRHKRH
jgi:Fe-S-cluster containining protein